MKKLIHQILSVITAFVMVFLSIAPMITTAYADEVSGKDRTATSDTPESLLTEQTLTATIYKNSRYKKVLDDDRTEITLSGKMPEGAVVKAYPVKYEIAPTELSDEPTKDGAPDTTGEVLLSYDISIFDGKKEFEPDGDTIAVTFKSPEIEKLADNEFSVIHVKDNGDEEEIIEKSADDGRLNIETDGFSVFVIIKHSDDVRDVKEPIVVFHYLERSDPQTVTVELKDGTTEQRIRYTAAPYTFETKVENNRVSTQNVKNGEKLDMVPTPSDYTHDANNESHFNGWYMVDLIEKDGNNITYEWPADAPRQVFNKTVTIEKFTKDSKGTPVKWSVEDGYSCENPVYPDENGEIHVYLAPLYVNYQYVNFNGLNNILVARKLLVFDTHNMATMLISDMEAGNFGNDYHFMGWSTVAFDEQYYDIPSSDPDYEKSQSDENTISIYSEGQKKETYITLENIGNGKVRIYRGKGTTLDTSRYIDAELNNQKDVELYAEYEKAHWLKFVAGETGSGALYVPSDYLVGKTPAIRLRTTTREGYTFKGWFGGEQDAQGRITINPDSRVTNNGVDSDTNNDGVYDTDTDGYCDVLDTDVDVKANAGADRTAHVTHTGQGHGELRTDSDTYLFADWEPAPNAPYKITIWKQKASDEVNLPVEERNYEFHDIINVQGYSVQTFAQQAAQTVNGYIDGEGSTFTGFHFSHYKVDQENKTYDNINQITDASPDPQGTTVLNMYFDRDVNTLTFKDSSGSPKYAETTDTNGDQYAFADGKAVKLTRTGSGTEEDPFKWTMPEYGDVYNTDPNGTYVKVNDKYVSLTAVYNTTTTYTADYKYTQNNTSTSNLFGIVSGEYVNVYQTTGTYTIYTGTSNLSNGYYWNGSGFTASTIIYYNNNNGKYYRNRTWSWGSYTYSNEVIPYTKDGNNTTYYIDADTRYTGTRYTRATDGSTDVTNSQTLNVSGGYYIDGNGGKVPITTHTNSVFDHYTYTINGTTTVYTNETRYSKSYGATGKRVTYYGTRYKTTSSGSTVYVIEALYEHDISNHFPITGYESMRWDPQANSLGWNQVMVYIPIMPNDDVTFERNDTNNNYYKTMNYYVQNLPGDTSGVKYDNMYFTLKKSVTPKYYSVTHEDYVDFVGFERYKWASGTKSGEYKTGGTQSGDSYFYIYRSSSNDIINFYYTRNTTNYTFTYEVNYPGGIKFPEGTTRTESWTQKNIPYEISLAGMANVKEPQAPEYYTFEGWYEDISCTKKFDFEHETMPAANKVVYAKWYPEYYLIEVDANGGTLSGENWKTQASYFWLQHGATIGRYTTERNYIEVDNVTAAQAIANPSNQNYSDKYLYRNVRFTGREHTKKTYLDNKTVYSYYDLVPQYNEEHELINSIEINDNKDFEGISPSQYRLAEYIPVTQYHVYKGNVSDGDPYDAFYTQLVDGFMASGKSETDARDAANAWDEAYIDSKVYRETDTSQNSQDPSWIFVGWNRVTVENGIEKLTPYNFGDAVDRPVKLRAEWRQTGRFFIHYDLDMKNDFTELGFNIDAKFQDGTRNHYEPANPTGVEAIDSLVGYSDLADTPTYLGPYTITGGPNDSNIFDFMGWRVVNDQHKPIDENGQPLPEGEIGTLYGSGDIFIIRHAQAACNSAANKRTIFMEAYYRQKGLNERNPDVVNLTLDPNKPEEYGGGYIDSNAADWPQWSAVNAGTVGAELDTTDNTEKIKFKNIQINNDIHLIDYYEFFKSDSKYFLLGFDEHQNPNDIGYIPKYPADAIIGADNLDPKDPNTPNDLPNYLYAIWEPMVYVTFENKTGGDIELDFTGSTATEKILVNDATLKYERSEITQTNMVMVNAGQTLRVVFPLGGEKQLKVNFTNNHAGYKLSAKWDAPWDNAPEAAVPGGTDLEYRQRMAQSDTQTLRYDANGLKYTFEEERLEQAYFVVSGLADELNHKSSGVWNENHRGDTYNKGTGHFDNSSPYIYESANDRFCVDITSEMTTLPKPEDPTSDYSHTLSTPQKDGTDPSPGFYREFIGWTVDPVIAKIYDYHKAVTPESIAGSTILSDPEKQHLEKIVQRYCIKYGIKRSEIPSLLRVVRDYCLYDFSDPPSGVTLYAVYSQVAAVNYHVMRTGTSDNHNFPAYPTGQEGETYELKDNFTDKDNRGHKVYSRYVVRGDVIIKPTNPTYYSQNSSYTFLYWMDNDHTYSNVSTAPSTANLPIFDFSNPIEEDKDLYTSWYSGKYCTLTLKKTRSGTDRTQNEKFNFSYTIKTYKYSVAGTLVSRAMQASSSYETGATLVTNYNSSSNEVTTSTTIDLFYWTDDNNLYEEEISINEENFAERGFTLAVTDGNNLGVYNPETDVYKYSPFYNYENDQVNVISTNNGANGRIWQYGSGEDTRYFYNNSWYRDSTATTADNNFALGSYVDFNNNRNVQVRFVKTDLTATYRLNDGLFKITRVLGTGETCPEENRSIDLISTSFKAAEESQALRGRMVRSGGNYVTRDDSMRYIEDEAEVEFRKDGTYILTEIEAPPGYQQPHPNAEKRVSLKVENGKVTASQPEGISFLHTCQLLSTWNSFESAAHSNEYAVVVKNEPLTTDIIIRNIDAVTGDLITTSSAVFNFRGTATQTQSQIAEVLTTQNGLTSNLQDMLYGKYTITQTKAPGEQGQYKLAEESEISIIPDPEDPSKLKVIKTKGANIVGEPQYNSEQGHKHWEITIKNEPTGYNLILYKSVEGDDADSETFTVVLTAQPDYVNALKDKTFAVRRAVGSGAYYEPEQDSLKKVEFDSSGVATVAISNNERVQVRAIPVDVRLTVSEKGDYQNTFNEYQNGTTPTTSPVPGSIGVIMNSNRRVDITNYIYRTPAPTAVTQVKRAAFVSLITLCTLGAGIYLVLAKRRKEVGYDAI